MSISNVLLHVVWSTRNRRSAIPEEFDPELRQLLFARAARVGCAMTEIGVASDHVHVVVRIARTITIASLVQHLKGGSAYEVNSGRRLQHKLQWQDGYFVESVSPGDLDWLLRYLRTQRTHHDNSHAAEMWQFESEEVR